MAKDINIGGRLHSIATGNVIAGADEILDDNLGKKQTQINTETYSLVESVNNALDALNPDQQEALAVAAKANANEAKLGYFVCDTGASVAAKTIAATGYVLGTGGNIRIKMTNANTADAATLNINSTGVKALFYNGTQASSTNSWEAGEVVEVYYDGTKYQCDGRVVDDEPTAGSDNLVKSGGVADVYGTYIESPEWIKVITINNKIICGIKKDGSIEWSVGIPTPIVDYIQNKIIELNINLATILDNKVDKVNGKGLSSNDYTDAEKELVNIQQYIDNPEFIEVHKDAAGKILCAIDKEGNIFGHFIKAISNEKQYIKVDLRFDEHAFIASGGNIHKTTSNYGLSQPIKVFKGDKLILKIKANAGANVLALCDESRSVIKPVIEVVDSKYNEYSYTIENGGYVVVSGNISDTYNYPILLEIERNKINQLVYDACKIAFEDVEYKINRHYYFENSNFTPEDYGKILCYEGDTKVQSSHIVNAVAYPNGEIIACRDNGTVVKIDNAGIETVLLTIPGALDWRGCYIDSNNNVYVSPHRTFGTLPFDVSNRGLYRLAYGSQTFEKVLALYNPDSSIETETQVNDDTIWTMCEDSDGVLYAGVYAHTKRPNPSIYKSIDNGITWQLASNLLEDGYVQPEYSDTGHPKHIHCVIYNKYDKALYCLVGEVETLFKSTDKGETWIDLNIRYEDAKGTTLIAVPDGILIGSDGTDLGVISKIYSDGKTVRTVARMWQAEFFAMRQSDVTGDIYAFTKIESSVVKGNYPPIEANTDPSVLSEWLANVGDAKRLKWEMYNDFVSRYYNHDSIHPTNAAILVSKDNGETWSIIYKFDTHSATAIGMGFFCIGYFRNGECLCGLSAQVDGTSTFVNPVIISEGKHEYSTNGLDLSKEIYNKLNN